MDVATYLKDRGPALTPEQAGTAITGLIASSVVSGPGDDQRACLLTAGGLRPLT